MQGALPIHASQSRVGGYVDPLALTAAEARFPILGFDLSKPRVAKINRGESVIEHIPADVMASAMARRLSATADFSNIAEPDAVSREYATLAGRRSVALDAATVGPYDAVLIATDQHRVDYRLVMTHSQLAVDTRNACHRAGIPDHKVVKA